MLITVVEDLYYMHVAKALDLAFKRIYARSMDPARIQVIKRGALVCKILIRMDLIFLIGPVFIEHTYPDRDYRPVCLVLTDHIYVFVCVRIHNIPIRSLPVTAL